MSFRKYIHNNIKIKLFIDKFFNIVLLEIHSHKFSTKYEFWNLVQKSRKIWNQVIVHKNVLSTSLAAIQFSLLQQFLVRNVNHDNDIHNSKLCVSLRSYLWIQIEIIVRKHPNHRFSSHVHLRYDGYYYILFNHNSESMPWKINLMS